MGRTRSLTATGRRGTIADAVLEALPHAVLVVDRDGCIAFANRAASLLLGREAESLLDRALVSCIEVDHRPAFERALRRVDAGVPMAGLECPLLHPDGGVEVWVEWEATPTEGGALFVGRDVRMRRVVRRALADQHEELRETLAGVLDSVPVGIVIADAKGGPRLVNRAARDLLGIHALAPIPHWCRSGVLRRPDGNCTEPADVPALQTLADGMPRRDVELHVVRPWGDAVPVLLSTDAVHDDRGRVIEVCCTFTDMRERRRIERRLQQAQKMEAVGTLAGGIAHDFNNILCAIAGYSELALTQAEMDDRGRHLVAEILTAGKRATTLTRQLLAFSRGEALAPRALDLGEVARGMDSMLERLLGEGVSLERAYAEGPCPITADPGQIEQVILNLVLNAADAMPGGGRVTLRTERVQVPGPGAPTGLGLSPGEHVVLVVEDEGCGMDEDTLAHVFEPFFTTKERDKGTGLGLSTVYGIVKQNTGRIHVESIVDTGSIFRVFLPLAAPDEDEPTPAPSAPPAPAAAAHILLVEDEDLVRALIREILEQEGHTVREAPNGAEALAMLQAEDVPFDLLVSDLIMPRMGGRDLADRLRRDRPDLRVLFVSGHADDALATAGAREPLTGFLPKPFDARTLTSRVRALLDLR